MGVTREIYEQAMTRQRIDTHSHFGGENPDLCDLARGWGRFETCEPMLNSKVCAVGAQALYDIDPGMFLRPDSPEEIFVRAAELRRRGVAEAFEYSLDLAKITLQLVFTDHRPEISPVKGLSKRTRFLAFVDALIAGDDLAFCPDGRSETFCYYDALASHFGALNDLDDYLDALDAIIDGWRDNDVVGIKTAAAYTRGLHFTDPSAEEARTAFTRKRDMTPGEVKTVQDFAFRHVLGAAKRNGLPVVIHTGFQIWGHAPLEQSNPKHLYNIISDARYRGVTFVLLHGGQPYVGETTYLAAMWPNVVIDFTWISWQSWPRFHLALSEWLEVVPHDRMCWGSDSAYPETIVGVDRITRRNIAAVLEDLIQRRILDERTALDWLANTYQKTPKRVFGL